MTTLYKPVLIESAEQAGALPIGTVAVVRNRAGAARQACIRVGDGWLCTEEVSFDGVQDVIGHKYMVGDQALVPIEAEEETVEKRKLCQKTPDVLRRYVTGWQHYTAEEQNR